jgi:hypothetical protein
MHPTHRGAYTWASAYFLIIVVEMTYGASQSTLSLAAIACHSVGIHTVTLLSLLSFSVKITVSSRATIVWTHPGPALAGKLITRDVKLSLSGSVAYSNALLVPGARPFAVI